MKRATRSALRLEATASASSSRSGANFRLFSGPLPVLSGETNVFASVTWLWLNHNGANGAATRVAIIRARKGLVRLRNMPDSLLEALPTQRMGIARQHWQ